MKEKIYKFFPLSCELLRTREREVNHALAAQRDPWNTITRRLEKDRNDKPRRNLVRSEHGRGHYTTERRPCSTPPCFRLKNTFVRERRAILTANYGSL